MTSQLFPNNVLGAQSPIDVAYMNLWRIQPTHKREQY